MANNNIGINQANLIRPDELVKVVTASAKMLLNHPEKCMKVPAIMLRGAPGVGKSTMVHAVAKELGIGFRDVRLAQMERVDFAGLPDIDKENHKTSWNVPDFWPTEDEPNGILLLDEITSAPSDVQVAAYSVVLDRAVPNSKYKLPDGWLIVAAGNRAQDRAVVKTMSSALANRFVHYEVEANAEDWFTWAVHNDIHPSVTGFIKYKPALLFSMDENQKLDQGWPSPRSWERVSTAVEMFGDDNDILRKNVHGLVGPGAATEFMAFHALQKEFDNILDIMKDPKKTFKVPEKADQKYAVASTAVYHLWNGRDDKETATLIDGFFKIVLAMPNDFAALMAKSSMLGNARVSRAKASELLMKSKYMPQIKEKYAVAFKEQQTAF